MQQISDHVRQEFMANSPGYLYPSQQMHTAAPGCNTHAMAMHEQQEPPLIYGQHPVGAATRCHASPLQTADATADPRLGAMPHAAQHHQPLMHMQASRSFVQSPSIPEQALSPQQVHPGNNEFTSEQHQMLASKQHLRTQPTAVPFASQSAPACRQLASSAVATDCLQHAGTTAGLHTAPVWQCGNMRLPQSSSIAPSCAPLSAAAPSPASMSCQEQCHLHRPPQHVTAVSMGLLQGDAPASGISTSQPSGLFSSSDQSMCASRNQQQQQQQGAVSLPAAMCSDNADGQMLPMPAGSTEFPESTMSLVAQTPSVSAGAALPMTQEATADSLERPNLQGNQLKSVQQQQWLQQQPPSATPATVSHALHNGLAQQAAVSYNSGAVSCSQLTRPISSASTGAAGFSSLLRAVEQGQPAVLSCAAAASVGQCSATSVIPATSAVDILPQTTLNSTDAPSAAPNSRTVPLPAHAETTGPVGSMPASVMPFSIASPEHAQAAATAHEQQLKPGPGEASLLPACQAQHLRPSNNDARCAAGGAAALLPTEPGSTGLATNQPASEGSFRFQTEGGHRQSASAGMCCTPVLRCRSHDEPYKAGM